ILAEVDRGEAQHAVQELYTRRFDVLRQFYGSGGAIDAGAAVAQAVDETDARLQQLIRQLATDESNGAAIGEAVRSAQAAVENIENATRAAGLPPTAPRDTIPTSP